jgi:hypothetical protein
MREMQLAVRCSDTGNHGHLTANQLRGQGTQSIILT